MSLLFLTTFQLIAIVAAGVAAGILIAKAVQLTFTWLTNTIKQKLAKRNVSKVAVCELEKVIKNCKNQTTIDELTTIQEQGISHFCVEVQNDGTIDEKSGIETWNAEKEDQQVSDLINRTDEGLLVVNS